MPTPSAIIDTNILVAAGFNHRSSSHRIITAIADEELLLIWNDDTREESLYIVGKIPPLDEEFFATLFRDAGYFEGPTDEDRFTIISDHSDRKFAALAHATDTILISNDSDFLDVRDELEITVLRPSEYLKSP